MDVGTRDPHIGPRTDHGDSALVLTVRFATLAEPRPAAHETAPSQAVSGGQPRLTRANDNNIGKAHPTLAYSTHEDPRETVSMRPTCSVRHATEGALNDTDIVEAAICLANGMGGLLLLGVEDDGRITGTHPRHGETTNPHRLQAMILNRTSSPLATSASVHTIDGQEVVEIQVPHVPVPVGSTSGLYVRRSTRTDGKPECEAFPLHEMLQKGMTAMGQDYAAVPARDAALSDLDPAEFERFRKLCEEGKGDESLAKLTNTEILRALRLLVPGTEEITLGAILLFGTPDAIKRFVPTSEAVFHQLKDASITTSETLVLPLFKLADRLFELVDARNSEQELEVGLHRVAVRQVSPSLVREAVANALVHRDYSQLGPVRVQIGNDQFRVQSPGSLPPGVTLETLLQDSIPRSPILAEAFKRAGIVDRAGRGVPKMFAETLRTGRGVPDYSQSNANAVSVTVEAGQADLEMVRFILEYENANTTHLPLIQLELLHCLKSDGPQAAAELAAELKHPPQSVRSALARLQEAGLVEARGTGKRKRFSLSASFYRTAKASEYVRLRGADAIQQEHLVLQFVGKYGSITRSSAAELCLLTPQQARSLLKGLVDAGKLELRGERRGSHYVLPGAHP